MKFALITFLILFASPPAFTQNNVQENSEDTCIKKIFSLDSNYSISIKTCTVFNKQIIYFNNQNKTIKCIDVDSISLLNKEHQIKTSFKIESVAIDTLDGRKVYIFYCYKSNGGPEIYLFYNKLGDLIVEQNCLHDKCEFKSKMINKRKLKSFFSKNKTVDFKEVY